MTIPLGIVSAFLLSSTFAFAQQYTISTVAGGAPPPTPVNALSAPLGNPGAITTDPSGDIYFVADDCVFRIDLTGNMTRVAGNSRVGFSGDGGAATSTQLNNPAGLAADNLGNVFIADSANNRIRKVNLQTGIITTIAGIATAGYSGDGQPATNAALNNPRAIALDINGNLYIADTGNHVIREIVAATGNITTVAGNGTPGTSGDSQPATLAQLNTPMGVGVDASLNIYIADSGNHRIREVKGGIISTIVGNGVPGLAGDNGSATLAQLNFPTAVAVDAGGDIYIDDSKNVRVRKVTPNGIINTFTGSPVSTPAGIGLDQSNNLYVTDSTASRILKFTSISNFNIIAGSGDHYYLGDGGPATSAQLAQPQGLALDAGNVTLYIADRGEARVRQYSGSSITSPSGAIGLGAAGVAVDSSGNLYIADAVGNQVWKVSTAGTRTTLAGSPTAGYSGDNSIATFAQLNQPNGVALDSAGNIYIADTGNNRIRKITVATNIITSIAGNGAAAFGGDNGVSTNAVVNQPAGVIVDSAGNVFIADTGNNRIRKITAATGIITTLAGNGNNTSSGDSTPATTAGISSPHGVAVDKLGNVYITDFSARIRRVSTNGIITTIAGNGTSGYSGDSGPAMSAQLSMPWGITVDTGGNLFISDVGEQAVRLLSPVTAPQLSIVTTALPSGTVGAPYAQALSATGGTPPYTWLTLVGTLPSGLTLAPSGSITGTPTAAGSFLLMFQVTDAASATATATISIAIAPSNPGGLIITTGPTLVPGAVGVNYSQPLAAAAGNPPYSWTVTSGALPAGLTLSSSGVISGTPVTPGTSTFAVRVTDNSGASANQSFSLTVISIGTLTRSGVLGHIAIGGGWTTRIYLTNISTSPMAVNLQVHADDGSALAVPLSVTQQGSTQLTVTSSLNGGLNPNTTMVIDSGANVAALVSGWIDVLGSGAPAGLSGFAIFRLVNVLTSEGTTPLQAQFEPKMYVPFDDTGSFITGVAMANLSPAAAAISATVLDINGNQIGTYSLQIPGNGHTAFQLPDVFAVSAKQQGLVQFVNTSGGNLAGVGLRINTQPQPGSTVPTFTSVPVILP